MLNRLVESVISLVFPAPCEMCGAPSSSAETPGVCQKCFDGVRLIGPPHCASCGRTLQRISERCGECGRDVFHFDRAFACAWYDEPMRKLLHLYKFGRRKSLKNFFSALMRRFVEDYLSGSDFDAVLPIPIDHARENSRGFNQSKLLSRELATLLKKKHLDAAVERRGANPPQAALTKAGRRRNVLGSFRVKKSAAIRSKNLLLVDDILTTGQTASECARALKEAGAASVTVLAFGRGA